MSVVAYVKQVKIVFLKSCFYVPKWLLSTMYPLIEGILTENRSQECLKLDPLTKCHMMHKFELKINYFWLLCNSQLLKNTVCGVCTCVAGVVLALGKNKLSGI